MSQQITRIINDYLTMHSNAAGEDTNKPVVFGSLRLMSLPAAYFKDKQWLLYRREISCAA